MITLLVAKVQHNALYIQTMDERLLIFPVGQKMARDTCRTYKKTQKQLEINSETLKVTRKRHNMKEAEAE